MKKWRSFYKSLSLFKSLNVIKVLCYYAYVYSVLLLVPLFENLYVVTFYNF